MQKPSFIFHNDGRHYNLYRFDPPMSLHRLRQPVDEVLGTGVDTLSFGLGSGQTFWHDTTVGIRWGERITKHTNGVMWWRAGENVRQALEAGIDPLKVVVDRAHEKGLAIIGSLKMNDPTSPEDEGKYWLGKLKWDHPQVMIGEEDPNEPKVATCSDYARAEVRRERLDVIEEICGRYELDGLEIDDCLKDSHVRAFFKPSQARANAPILTGLIRDIRALLDDIGKARGRRLMLASRVHPVEEGNLAVGMDVRSWLSEGMLDAVLPYLGGSQSMLVDSQQSFDWLIDAAHESGAGVYPRIGRLPYDDRYHDATIQMQRADATNLRARGADGVYMEHLAWPHNVWQYQALRELGDPDIYARKSKLYMFAPGTGGPDSAPLGRVLPIVLEEGMPVRVPIFIGDALGAARADGELDSVKLGVRIVQTNPLDRLSFGFNGRSLALDNAKIRTVYGGNVAWQAQRSELSEGINTYYWYDFDLPLDLVRERDNVLEVMMEHHFKAMTADRVLHHVEVTVEYVEPGAGAEVPVRGQM